MSATSRRRKAAATSEAPNTHVVLSLDTYMGDGDGAADYGYAGVNAVYGPFSEADANALVAKKEKENAHVDAFTEYRVKRLETV